jgi:hypothetical protein
MRIDVGSMTYREAEQALKRLARHSLELERMGERVVAQLRNAPHAKSPLEILDAC